MRLPLRPAALVSAWFDLLPPGQVATTRAVHTLIAAQAPGWEQGVKWGVMLFTAAGLHAMALAPHRNGLHVQVFRGAELLHAFPQLEGHGRGLRYLRLRYGDPVDEALLCDLVRAVVDVMPDGPAPR